MICPARPRILFTWLSTARGGADQTLADLANAFVTSTSYLAEGVWWRFSTAAPGPPDGTNVRWHLVTGPSAYMRSLAHLTTASPAPTAVLSSHRTVAADLSIAVPRGIPVVAVVRGILVPGLPVRTVSADAGVFRSLPPEDWNWDRLALARWVGISAASAASIRPFLRTGQTVVAIPNGVDFSALPAVDNDTVARVFVTLSRIVSWKRLDVVLEAWSRVPKLLASSALLQIMGSGADLASLRELAARSRNRGSIEFRGWQANPADALARASFLVSSSYLEGFGRAVVEAGAMGVPAIVPTRSGSAELIIPGRTGYVFDCHMGAEALTERMIDAMTLSQPDFQAMRCAASVHARTFFTAAGSAARFANFIVAA
ncbi:MAG: hypothetical protein QOH83_2518 [Solirubrobacteraceae bacterium]|nr:hypothetical protein [Solirubrobacteraceae bacterium]